MPYPETTYYDPVRCVLHVRGHDLDLDIIKAVYYTMLGEGERVDLELEIERYNE